MSKNRRVSASGTAYYHVFVGMQNIFFHLTFRGIFATDFADFTDGRRFILSGGICKRLIGRGFRSTIQKKAGKMAEE
jgi:hypothetical protein